MNRFPLVIALPIYLAAVAFGNTSPADETKASETVTHDQVRQAIEESLPYLERQGVWWIEEKKCVSCHRVSFQTWSLGAAKQKGFDVDESKVSEWIDWSFEKSLAKPDDGKEVDGARNVDGLAQMILARPSNPDPSRHQADYAEFNRLLVAGQQPEGFWKAAGQLPGQKRPKEETDQVTTMWIALALGTIGDRAAVDDARSRALKWLEASKPGKSVEWYVASLLLTHQDGDRAKTDAALEKLRSLQNDDGGWGWLVGDKSDALATGQALYALATVGVAVDDPAIRRAQQFLIESQKEDGSWAVNGTKASKKDRIEETATYWGTGWAAIGLLATLGNDAA